ncbi:hypothetical protein [Pseudoxanthomonas sp. LARHCG66]|jgi:hypothetical protein
MRHFTEAKHVTLAVVGAALISWGVIAIPRWPQTLSLLLDGMFFLSLVSMLLALALVWLMYSKRIAATDHKKALFSALLIFLSVSTYAGLEAVAKNTEFWKEGLANEHGTAIIFLSLFVLYGKNLVALGIGAIGAGVLANQIK